MYGISFVQKEVAKFVSHRETLPVLVVVAIDSDKSLLTPAFSVKEAGQVVFGWFPLNRHSQCDGNVLDGHRRGLDLVPLQKTLGKVTNVLTSNWHRN